MPNRIACTSWNVAAADLTVAQIIGGWTARLFSGRSPARLAGIVTAFVFATATTLGPALAAAHGTGDADQHAHHHHLLPGTNRTVVGYTVPDVKLVRDDGKSVSLGEEINDGRPVVMAFIYTTCTTVCPVTSQTLSELQSKLGAARDRVHLVSISIDPEHDTPAKLREYAQKFGAGPAWQHYTGTLAASRATQQAFDVYRGNKMDHAAVTLVRTKQGAQWVRLDGFATSDQLLAELPALHASR